MHAVLLPELTEPRVEHVERHPVALLGARDCDEALIAVVLWLVNLDHATTDLADLIDLLPPLANDGPNHVIGNVDLLSERRSGHGRRARHGLSMGTSMGMRSGVGGRVRLHVGPGPIGCGGSMRSIMHRDSGGRVRRMGVTVVRRIRLRRHVVRSRIWAAPVVVVPIAVVAAGRLGIVGDHLHPARDGASRAAAASRVGRSRGPAETLVELLQKRAAHVVGCDVDRVGHAHHDQRALRGQGQARVRRV